MAPPPKQKLIKGQGSLAGYFAGGAMKPAESASSRPSSTDSSPAKSNRKRTPPPAPEVKELSEKISVAGYKPKSPTPSPIKSKAPPVSRGREKAEAEAAQAASANGEGSSSGRSKYFGNGNKSKAGAKEEPMEIDDDEEEEDIKPSRSKARASSTSRKRKAPSEDPSDDEVQTTPKRRTGRIATRESSRASQTGKSPKTRAAKDDEEDEDAEGAKSVATSKATPKKSTPRKNGASTPGKAGGSKAQAIDLDEDEDDEAEAPSADVKSTTTKSKTASSKGSAPPPKENEKAQKAALQAAIARAAAGPSAPGSKDIPEGKPNCLIGLSFVFTGQMESLSRDDATMLVKRHGAKVTGQPSSKTSYVVLGEGAGPSKLKKITENKLKTLSEDELLDLIRTRGGQKPDEAAMKKLKEEEAKIEKAAKAMAVGAGSAASGQKGGPFKAAEADSHSLWTTKYAPTQMKDVVGNNAAVEKLKTWLEKWPEHYKANFKKPGPTMMGCYRAVMMSGPPGIGKTTAAHLTARLAGYVPLEMNASDTRSKKLIEDSLKGLISNKSLDGWYGGGQMKTDDTKISDRTVLILDEVDGMSGGDRGGVGAINQLIKKTRIPIILIANDRKNQKMRPFDHTSFDLKFQKPKADSIRSRLMTIAFREGLKVDRQAMDQLIAGARGDIRLIINMLSTWKLSQSAMTFDEGKQLGDANTKPGMLTPWNIYDLLAGHGLWAPSSKKTLNQKADLYFQDFGLVPLFVQENYLRQRPERSRTETNPALKDLKTLQLFREASSSISDGDVIDGMIHGSQQHWSLLPTHAIFSTLKPMSLVYGMGAEGSYGAAFPSWLGKNSMQGRLSRATVELQTKMRLAASGSRWEVREQYAPYLFKGLSQPLLKKGQDGIEPVVELLDDYFLDLEDRETILELGVGNHDGAKVLKDIPTAVKSAFTRRYNSSSHPIAIHKYDLGSGAKAKQLKGDAAPDAEEAIVEDDAADVSADEVAGDSDDDDDTKADFSKDKMVKQKKQSQLKGKGKSKS